MSIVTITLVGKDFTLSCSEDSRDHIVSLAETLDMKLRELSKTNTSSSLEMLLVIIALSLMDEKDSHYTKSGDEILMQVENNHEKQLLSLFERLKNIADKF